MCHPCSRHRQRPWILHKKDKCEKCGFVPEDWCQLDVDHIDANKLNNDPSNLQTLCANCHRLKTQKEKDYAKRYTDGSVAVPNYGFRIPNVHEPAL